MTTPRLVIHMTADDLGAEQCPKFGRTGTAQASPAQPFMDMLYDEGVRFERHYAEGFCSPYRACHMTGRHTEDHGIGDILESESDNPLLLSELLLPEVLKIYYGAQIQTACIGKWHLGTEEVGGRRAPLDAGFDYAFSTTRNIDYFTSELDCMGQPYQPLGRYIPDILGEAAITWLRRFAADRNRIGYLYLPFHLPHDPYHRPTAGLYDAGTWTLPEQTPADQGTPNCIPYGKAMVEAYNTWAMRIWDSIPARLQQQTLILSSSDNGSDVRVLAGESYPVSMGGGAYVGTHGKRSYWDPGWRTPAWAYSPNEEIVAAPGRSVTGLVQGPDWFATTLEMLGLSTATWHEIVAKRGKRLGVSAIERSKSVAPNIQTDLATTDREYAIGGIFTPNGYNRGTALGRRAITDGRYKLKFPTATDAFSYPELYDIVASPTEDEVVEEAEYEAAAGEIHPERARLQAAFDAFYASLPPLPA